MAGILDVPKPRINCSMLSQHINRPVCFLGRVEKVHSTGKTFTMLDGEGQTATVELNEPLEEELSGIVEVIGMVSNKGVLMATTYNILQEDKGIPFGLELYNEAVKVLHDFPQYYPFQVTTSS
ncbi:replication protein A 14 kDa subunit [Kryptolebias marmoratus]|uniref:Replication protein A 14kDa subunit n=1 Tax=Kryptolebias marmoratus TaxID=37003 RepID=G4W903_KRYMA|nr:replication protein A 14 kDa subunit [Kryptolebias marmoratus]AEM65194.1 replication protein A 14kDa subunit [Kryptolebias marmoratus]